MVNAPVTCTLLTWVLKPLPFQAVLWIARSSSGLPNPLCRGRCNICFCRVAVVFVPLLPLLWLAAAVLGFLLLFLHFLLHGFRCHPVTLYVRFIFRCRVVEVIPDYRLDFGKFQLRDFEEVEAGRVLQLVHHVGKKVGKEITVTVEFQKFAVVLRRYGLKFPVFIHAFTALIVFFSLSSTRRISIICSSVWTGWLCLHP